MLPDNCTMVIYGGSGDLAHRKLVPAIYNLFISGQLPPAFSLIGIGRKKKSSADYRNQLSVSVKKYSPSSWDEDQWHKLSGRIRYLSGDIHDQSGYSALKEFLARGPVGQVSSPNYLFYLAVAPQLFAVIAENLKISGLAAGSPGWSRIMIEKPFGSDLDSAARLNDSLNEAFREKNIYRVDHYLGKEMLYNTMVIRFANTIFEPLWNNRYIDNVQISAVESDGIGDRGRYYEQSGAMRDMFQSHLLQMFAVTAMEPPEKNNPESIRREKLKLLKSVELWPGTELKTNSIFGQYTGFRVEKDIPAQSQTETYAAVKLAVNNTRWQGVPFYLRTGKKLNQKVAKIVIQYKEPVNLIFPEELSMPGNKRSDLLNLLTLKVQPSEGVVFQFNIKKPATTAEIVPVNMDFCQSCAFLINTPEAYERLLIDAICGDSARFISWDELESAWKLTDSIYHEHEISGQPLYYYEPGATGPPEAVEMLSQYGLKWWD